MNTPNIRFGALQVSGFENLKPEYKNNPNFPSVQSAEAFEKANRNDAFNIFAVEREGDTVTLTLAPVLKVFEEDLAADYRDKKGLTVKVIPDPSPDKLLNLILANFETSVAETVADYHRLNPDV